jgi:hypothetical protein
MAILQRCDDEAARMANRVRFVRFSRKLGDIIGIPPGQDEDARQDALEAVRKRILETQTDCQNQDWRIIVKDQKDLWSDGVRAGMILGAVDVAESSEDSEDEEEEGEVVHDSNGNGQFWNGTSTYTAGKWGRYVRAPDVYFDIMRRFGARFAMLGEIATVRYGVKTGCDAFFAPRDVSSDMLAKWGTDRSFRQHCGGAPRKDVESGRLRIIEDGAGVIHPIETTSVAPEVHSMMRVDRPVIHRKDVDRVVLLVNAPLDKLKAKAPWTWRYLRYGTTATFPSRKSQPVPVPKRSFISKRPLWYDLTDQVKPGTAIWPKGQQYRHLVASNPDGLVANCRLYDIAARSLELDPLVFAAVLNSTLVALWRNFYGRYTGTEGAMETMVVDALMTEVPNPTIASDEVAARLRIAFHVLCLRDTGDFVEEQLMDCHTPERARKLAAGPLVYSHELKQPDRRDLDDATLELLGVSDPKERDELIGRLYEATARHFRDIRVVEIEKMEQRAKSDSKRFSVYDLAADIWDAAELEDVTPLCDWIGQAPESDSLVSIPEERPAAVTNDVMFSPNTVFFGKKRKSYLDCHSHGQAELVARLANLGLSGEVKLPADSAPCIEALARVNQRVEKAVARFKELAESRTSDERIQEQLMEVLGRWFVLGRETTKPGPTLETDAADTEA